MIEFRAWLSGIEDMQPDDWSPSRDQWIKIRAKIDSVEGLGTSIDQLVQQRVNEQLQTVKQQADIANRRSSVSASPSAVPPGFISGEIPLDRADAPLMPPPSAFANLPEHLRPTNLPKMSTTMPTGGPTARVDAPPSLGGLGNETTPSDLSGANYQPRQFL